MEHPLEGGQRPANTLGLVPDGRAPGPDGRVDARAIDGRLARGLPERDTPDLRVDRPVGPAARVEPRHDDADAPRPQLIRRAEPIHAEMASQPVEAHRTRLDPCVGPRPRDVVRHRAPQRHSEDLRRQAGQLHPGETPAGVEVDPERSRHRCKREPRDLDPFAAKVATRARAPLARREREPRLDAAGKHVHADGGGRQGRVQHVERGARLGPPATLRRPGDLAVGQLRAALHRACEARHRPGEPQVSGAPELAEPEPLVLKREGAFERREIAEARAHAPRGAVARREARAGRERPPASSGRRPRARREAMAPGERGLPRLPGPDGPCLPPPARRARG